MTAVGDILRNLLDQARVQPEIKWGAWVDVQLLTYREGDAERVLGQVGAAIGACAGGYVDNRLREFPATDSMDEEWYPFDEHTVMVRDGQQLLTFRTGSVGDDAEARALLAAVVDAQWERYAATR